MMEQHLGIVIILWTINALVALAYLLITLYRDKRSEAKEGVHDRRKTWILFIMMLLCVGVGPLFLGIAWLLRHTIFHNPVDLEDAVFSKDRVDSRHPADTERERNMAPMEEALAVSDKSSLRTLMMNVLKGDVSGYLSSISKALNSSDSETAHYAATVLRDELNNFRTNVATMVNRMEEESGDEMVLDGQQLLAYMNEYLMQNIFTSMEQLSYVNTMEAVAQRMYDYEANALHAVHFEYLCLRLLDTDKMEECCLWCNRGMEVYPEELTSYTCLLRYYFKQGDRDAFMATLESLKKSNIIINNEVLELIRMFSN
ncbi:MAG: hypothetical protein K6G04_01185 [Lachnospiraceae bacterium]|nr:hypothetical protein [Lachnospiraceae bacterium]